MCMHSFLLPSASTPDVHALGGGHVHAILAPAPALRGQQGGAGARTRRDQGGRAVLGLRGEEAAEEDEVGSEEGRLGGSATVPLGTFFLFPPRGATPPGTAAASALRPGSALRTSSWGGSPDDGPPDNLSALGRTGGHGITSGRLKNARPLQGRSIVCDPLSSLLILLHPPCLQGTTAHCSPSIALISCSKDAAEGVSAITQPRQPHRNAPQCRSCGHITNAAMRLNLVTETRSCKPR